MGLQSQIHAVRVQRCGHLVLFRTKSRPRPQCGSPVPDMSRNKRGYLQDLPTWAPAAVQGAANYGGFCCMRACVLCSLCACVCAGSGGEAAMTMHACSCLCCPRACERSARPWDWLPCEWMRPITKEAMHSPTEDSHCSFASHCFTVRNLLSFIDYRVLLSY
jgi:hypothetical protein